MSDERPRPKKSKSDTARSDFTPTQHNLELWRSLRSDEPDVLHSLSLRSAEFDDPSLERELEEEMRRDRSKRDSSGTRKTIEPRQPNISPETQSVRSMSHSADILRQAVKGEYQYAKLGLVLGLATIIGGVLLGLHGVVGHTSWTAKVLGLQSQINDAAPGVVLFIVGIFFVFITKPRVDLGDLKG